jgi:hypothetical protein
MAAAAGRLDGDRQCFLGGPGAGHRDDEVGRASPAGQLIAVCGDDLGRAGLANHGRQHVAGDTGTAHTGHHDGPRPAGRRDRGQVGLGAGAHRRPDLGRGRGHLTEHAAGVGRFN